MDRNKSSGKKQIIVSSDKTMANPIKSEPVNADPQIDLTAVLEVKGLKASTVYYYDVLFNGKSQFKDKAVFRTYPSRTANEKISIAFGGGARYISQKERIWDTILKRRPNALLMLGDNLYIDLPKLRNMQNLYYYRRYLRPEWKRLSASVPVYSIWDDHDFGANDSAGGPEKFKPDWKLPVWKVFRNNWNNPYYAGGETQPGCWYDFNIGDIDFFMTDGRYYRDFKKGKTMLGPVQKKWLLDKLKASKARIKVIASGTLWTEFADKGGKDSWWGVKEEREEIFSLIEKEKIPGVVLISADRHRSEVFRIKRPNGYDLYEFESSKLTNNHTHGANKKSLISYNKGNFFGFIEFDLSAADPTITFKCITIDNKETQNFQIKLSDLQFK